jgi:FAD/FMN-containing dehydrogenase
VTAASPASLVETLAGIVGAEHVLTDTAQRRFHSTDLASEGALAICVVQPADTPELSRVVALCTGAGHAVIPRGGGYSYTGGYLPVEEGVVMLDLRRMNRIVEINEQDLYVTVECGCTWRELYEALKARGLRTPYFGPMSGYWATVGGALSQGSFFLGSSQHGTVAESVLSLEVMLADGSTLRTGSAGSQDHPSPFFRWYGPDLSGLFLSDTGAMGIKLHASLRLMPWPQHQRFATFALDNLPACVNLVSEIGRRGLAAECYSWDPTFVKSVGERTGMLGDIKFLAGVVGAGSSFLGGVKEAARIALAGKRVLDGSTYLVHVTIDDVSSAGAEERLKLVQALAAAAKAGEVEASVPRATRALPFADFKTAGLATKGIRNLPTNGLCPHSRSQELASAVGCFFRERESRMAAEGITWGVIVFAVGAQMICVEPLMYWSDPQFQWHDRIAERSNLQELDKFDGPLPVAQTVAALRRELVELFTRMGCAHVQIGKSYRWAETRQPAVLRAMTAIKQVLDPGHRMNPGSLGL